MRRPTAILNKLVHRSASLGGDPTFMLPGARRIGEGCARVAYRIGAYVVKDGRDIGLGNRNTPPLLELRRVGVLPPQQWRRNGWVVQPFYRLNRNSPVHSRTCGSDWDLHNSNVGFDARGRAVAFDW